MPAALTDPCRLAELAGGLSLAGDLADGFPEGKAIRTAALASELGRLAGASDADRRAAYFVSLVRFLGCTGFAFEESHRFGAGEDIVLRNTMAMADPTQPLATVSTIVANVGRGAPLRQRVKAVTSLLSDRTAVAQHARAQCDTSLSVARAFGLEESALGVSALMERWDGKGAPHGLKGDAIPLGVQLMHAADVLETTWHREGWNAALAQLRVRKGKHLAPSLVEAALSGAQALHASLERRFDWEWFLESEPTPHVQIGPDRIREVAACVGRLVDLKSTFTLGHSGRVAQLAESLGRALSLPESDVVSLGVAGHLHDVGRMAIPNSVWDKPGPFSRLDRERAELHTVFTDRVLRRAPQLEGIASLAAGAHERIDGSGYHRRLPSGAVDRLSRVLSVCDVAAALGEERPHRPARGSDELARVLRRDCPGLEQSLIDAVLEVLSGRKRDGRRSTGQWPRGLTDREVEVLRCAAIGKSNVETASILGISARTVQNHLANAYDKLGVSSRGGAALFMMEHGLVGAT